MAVLFLVKGHPGRLLPRDLAFNHRLAEELGLTLGRAPELAPLEEGDQT